MFLLLRPQDGGYGGACGGSGVSDGADPSMGAFVAIWTALPACIRFWQGEVCKFLAFSPVSCNKIAYKNRNES